MQRHAQMNDMYIYASRESCAQTGNPKQTCVWRRLGPLCAVKIAHGLVSWMVCNWRETDSIMSYEVSTRFLFNQGYSLQFKRYMQDPSRCSSGQRLKFTLGTNNMALKEKWGSPETQLHCSYNVLLHKANYERRNIVECIQFSTFLSK